MNVVVITGDKSFGPGHPRFELQKMAVENLSVIYMGKGGVWPKIPEGKFSSTDGPASGWEVVSTQDPLLRGVFGWFAAKRLGARLNVQVHMDLRALPRWKRLLATIVLRRADSVRVVSEKIKQQVESMSVRAKISVLPVFVDVERFRDVPRQSHPQKTILWIGRFEDEKDPLYAVSVFKQVREAKPRAEVKLVMLGNGSLEPSLRKEISRSNLGGKVELPGWQDPRDYLAAADVVLCTSRHESWGASIVEALAANVPVVAPDVGIAREAGAMVVARSDLAFGVVEALRSGARGELKLHLLNKDEWARAWKKSLQ